MSTLSRTKYLAATLAAATCFMFASGVGAAGVNDDQNEFADPFSSVCHPAYLPCQKWQNVADRVAKASATPQVLIAQTSPEPTSGVCHPARQACASWTRGNQPSNVAR